MPTDITQHDARIKRCPMLGHEVKFSYCRAPAPGRPGAPVLPCRKVFDCWWETFDVTSFMQSHFTAEQIQKITAPPPAKTASLIELIQRAQQQQ